MKEIDRRIIYFLVLIFLSVPLIFKLALKPAKMHAADSLYQKIEQMDFKPGEVAFMAFDFGPSTKAENEPQARVMLEHLFRKHIPVVLFSLTPFAEPFLKLVPEEISKNLREETGDFIEYGKDWINLGFKPGGSLFLQSVPKAKNIKELLQTDTLGNKLVDMPALKNFENFEDIKILGQFTGAVGGLDRYLEFFRSKNYQPFIAHGCTSITIPESYIYLDSQQINGLFEGIAGSAWYSHLLSKDNSGRKADEALVINTGLGVAHLLVIFLILTGNLLLFMRRKK